MSVVLTGNDLTFDQLHAVALHHDSVSLHPSAIERMNASRAVVEKLVASGATAYGINTGFGKLSDVRISTGDLQQLQRNAIEPEPIRTTRAIEGIGQCGRRECNREQSHRRGCATRLHLVQRASRRWRSHPGLGPLERGVRARPRHTFGAAPRKCSTWKCPKPPHPREKRRQASE